MMNLSRLEYFSGVLNTIHQKPGAYDLDFLKPFEGINSTKDYSKVPWVSDIRREMKREMIRKMIHEGIPMALKAKGFSKEIMIGIANALIDGGKFISKYLSIYTFKCKRIHICTIIHIRMIVHICMIVQKCIIIHI